MTYRDPETGARPTPEPELPLFEELGGSKAIDRTVELHGPVILGVRESYPANSAYSTAPQQASGLSSTHRTATGETGADTRRVGDPSAAPEKAHAEIPDGYYLHKASGEVRRKTRKRHNVDYIRNPDPVARFWEKVNKTETCWLWTGAITNGYGHVRFRGRVVRAHRAAWEIVNGRPFPEGLHACHSCDVKNCVNPDHLFPGTALDNLKDAALKHILPVKITDAQVADIRRRRHAGERLCDLARELGIHVSSIVRIANGSRRQYVAAAPTPITKASRGPGENNPASKLTDADVLEIDRLRLRGMSFSAIGRLFGVHRTTAWMVATRRGWKHIPAVSL